MAEKVSSTGIDNGFLNNISLFSGLSSADKEALLKKGNIRCYGPDEPLFRQGDPIRCFYVICSGTVRLYHQTEQGGEVTTDIRIAGDTICTTCVFAPFEHHSVNAATVHNASIMELPLPWIMEAARQHSVIAVNLLAAISRRASGIKVDALNQMTMSPVHQLACFLKRMCVAYGFNPEGFSLPYSKSLLASRIGLRPETLSRAMPKLKEIGIDADGRKVALRDLKSIDNNLCSHCLSAEICHARKALMSKSDVKPRMKRFAA